MYGGLLVHFSPWTVVVLTLAAVPVFVAETRFSEDAFRLFRWRAPETRMQIYLESLLAREDNAKAIGLLRQSIAENPDADRRHQALALALGLDLAFGWTGQPD